MTVTRGGVPEPPRAPDSVQVMATGEQPFLSRAARRQAREALGVDGQLPPIAHTPRYLSLIVTVVAAVLIAVSAAAGELMLAAALLLGSLIVAWGWPRAAGLPSPKGVSLVLTLSAVIIVAAALAAGSEPQLRWVSAAVALGLIAAFLQQLFRRDGRPRLTESATGAALGLVVIAAGAVFLPFTHLDLGPALVSCSMAAVAAGIVADLLVRHDVIRPWLLPLAMVIGGIASVVVAVLIEAPDIPPAALIGVCSAALSHAFRRMLAPEAGSYSGQGQIATGLACIGLVAPLLWAINELVVR